MAEKLFGIPLQNERVKWLMVGGLAAVLAALVCFQDSEEPGALPEAERPPARRPASRANSAGAAKGPVRKGLRMAEPTAETARGHLDSALEFNPFALTPKLKTRLGIEAPLVAAHETGAAATAADPQSADDKRLSEFRDKKVSAVFRTADGAAAALIGNRLVREGDVVDGVRIKSITAQGVVVETP